MQPSPVIGGILSELVLALPCAGGRSLSPLAIFPLGFSFCGSSAMFGLENLSVVAFMGIGHWELMVVMVVVVLLFGHRLPGMMRSVGQGLKEFKAGMNETAADDAPSGNV